MIVAESTRHRRFVGRLDAGADLLTQLTEVCRARDVRMGEVRATGTVEDANFGDRRLAGPAEILSFAGVVRSGVEAAVSLAHGGAVVGGKLLSARVVACDFVVDAYDDVAAEKAPSFEAPARTTWSDVVAASDRKPEQAAVRPAINQPDSHNEPDHSDTVHVQVGDYIDHPKFGRCAVERVDGDMEFVTARLRNQRLIRLSLDVLTLIPAGQADGKNLFRAVAGK